MNYSWGRNLEIAAIRELYNVRITVSELSQFGELATPFDTPAMATLKDLKVLYLVRHRRIHYDAAMKKNKKLSMPVTEGYTSNGVVP